jgi:Helicase conserved C-terminal domain
MTDLRDKLVQALESDLVGPFSLEASSTEVLPLPPTRWYLTGFLAPENAPAEEESTEDREVAAGDDQDVDGATDEKEPRGPRTLPSSVGLSVLLPPGAGDHVDVTLRYATYRTEPGSHDVLEATPMDGDGLAATAVRQRRPRARWVRLPASTATKRLACAPSALDRGTEITPGLFIVGHIEEARAPGVVRGARALSLFVVNRRPIPEKGPIDEACIFQVSFDVCPEAGLLPRSDPRGQDASERHEDDRIADLQFRDRKEWAVGHGVSVEPITGNDGVTAVGARTAWVPRATVHGVEHVDIEGVTVSMDALSRLDEPAQIRAALEPLVNAYGRWLEEQARVPLAAPTERTTTRETLLLRAETARQRIQAGIDLLADGADDVRAAFRWTNEAMALAARKRDPKTYANRPPSWRSFQLAFLLMNLESVANPASAHRSDVELIFFPTGGGKTEAYLGVIAFALLLRRLRAASSPDAGLGVAVILRYTLRLLTLDQLGRGATLICALELRRKREAAALGAERFAIGLWVGRGASPNSLEQAVEEITSFRLGRGASPCPLPVCPWCKTPLDASTLRTEPPAKPTRVIVGCKNPECDFSPANDRDGLPVLFVDDQIYRELPCFLVGTVDKFAMLPWRGRTAMLFGRATSRIGRDHFGPMDGDTPPKGATKLPAGLQPPELIVQDELHLISGPLGTMVGLYETGIDALCSRESGGVKLVPKILASTATVRRAEEQVRAIFGRRRMHVFPPPSIDDGETFFSRVDRASSGRLYIGVAAPGRPMKAVLISTYVALLGAAKRLFDDPAVDRDVADAYMTLIGYFNSLRELGGMRRLVEDEIRWRLSSDEKKRAPVDLSGPHPWVRKREIKYEPVELTSRESTASIAEAKEKLGRHHPADDHVDVALASNMISVGLDIERLGLMVIAGQPKTTSEYIQASSRIGRNVDKPGLVVTVYNFFKARDRSHYERFRAYHESFYRFVEAGSVTPFSAPALDRGLAGLLVAMTRLSAAALTPPDGVSNVDVMRPVAEQAIRRLAEKAAFEKKDLPEEAALRVRHEIMALGRNCLEAWALAVSPGTPDAAVRYSDLEAGKGEALLFTALDASRDPSSPRGKFKAPTSMRDVEASVHLWKARQLLADEEGGDGR